jgi:NCS2 family nucleobase:cation symporter-2
MTTSTTNHSPPAVHPVDEKLPLPQLTALGLQHVLVMYGGRLPFPHHWQRPQTDQRGHSIPDRSRPVLLRAVTIIQSMGIGKVGIRLPMMMGVTFTAVAPIIAAGSTPG